MLAAVPLGKRIPLGGIQRSRDLAHLLVDVVVPRPGGEGFELRLEVGALLSFERRRTLLEPERAMTGGAGRDGPNGIAERDQPWRRIGWAADLRGKRSEISGHIGDLLIVERRGHALHDRVLPLAR